MQHTALTRSSDESTARWDARTPTSPNTHSFTHCSCTLTAHFNHHSPYSLTPTHLTQPSHLVHPPAFLSPSSVMRSLLLLSLLVSLLSVVSGQSNYAFCFTATQTNPTSPTLPWAVQMSGTLSINTSASALTLGYFSGYIGIFPASQQMMGYPVLNAVGSRTVYSLGTTQTLSITGVAPVNTYNGNDNIIALSAPYFDNLAHSISFTLSGAPQFALGTIASQGVVQGNPGFVNLINYTTPLYGGAGVQESDDPPNDGNANVLTSTFTLTPASSFSATNPSCTALTAPAAAPSTFASTLTWSFCYQFTGGGNFATVNGQQWFITGSGTITTTAYAGTTVSGQTAYLITGMTGTRTYTNAGTGTSQTVNILGVGGPNTQQAVDYAAEQFAWLEVNGLEADLSNNLLYPSYPYFDQWGVSVITDSDIGNEDQNNLTVNAFRLWVDPNAYSFNEWVSDFTAGYWYFTYSANALVTPSSQSTPAALLPQCSFTAGSTVSFQFCYYIDNIGQSNSTFTYAYGTMTATGPVQRNGRTAYTAQTINGVRTITVNGVTNSSAIIYLEWIQSDLNWGFINNNLIYTTAPYLDQQGIIFATSQGPIFSNGAVPAATEVYYGYTDVALFANNLGNVSLASPPGIAEYSVLTPTLFTQGSTTSATASAFNVAPLAASSIPSSATCAYTGANTQYIAPIATTTWSYCYVVNGADQGGWQTYTYGTLTTYNTVIWSGGLQAYAVQNITGTRTYQAPGGAKSSVTITGINSNNQGADGWVYDNLVYATAPYFDSDGLVYNFAGTAQTIQGPVSGDGVATINIFVYTGFFQEEFYTTTDFSVYGDVVGPTAQSFQLVQDSGSTGNTGAVLSKCGVSTSSVFTSATMTFGFCYAISNTLSTSPYLPWAVVTSGTFTVASNSFSTGLYQQSAEYPGYLIQSGTGTRTVYSATSATPQTQTITVLPVNSYNTNDNILQPAAAVYPPNPAYPLLSLHGISFSTGTSPVALPQGTVNTIFGPLNNLTLVGWQSPSPSTAGNSMPITEADLPFNDGVTNTIVAYMQVTYTDKSSPPSCTGGNSPVVLPTYSASLASTIASTVQYQFCYSFTGWDSLGTNWTIATSGTFTASGYLGNTTTGQQARLIVGASGQRVLTLGNGTSFTTPLLGIGGFNAYQFQAETTADLQFNTYFSANNILYMQWPYFDAYGVSLQGSTNFWEPNGEGLNTGNTALKLFIDPSTFDVAEWLLDWAQFTYYVGEAGTLQVSPSSSVSNTNDFYAQCQANYGTRTTYQWCYYEDRSGGNNPYYVQAYGTMVATGPVTRQGMTAYTIQSMTGARSFYNLATGVVSTNPILALQYVNFDEGYGGGGGLTFWVTNDNYVFTQSPWLSENGFIYTTFPTPNNPMFPQGINTASGDIQVNVNQTFPYGMTGLGLQENGVGSEDTTTDIASFNTQASNFGFSYTAGGLSSTSKCSQLSPRFQYPQLVTYSFCYVITGTANNNFTVASSGTITVYNINVTSNLQYPGINATIVAAVSGYRQYTDGLGNSSYITFTGLGSNWYAEEGWDYDQLLYSNNAALDDYGILITFSGTAQSPSGPVYGDLNSPVINIFSDGTNFQEEGWYGQFTNAYDLGVGGVGGTSVFKLVSDNGNSGNGNSILGQCGFSGSPLWSSSSSGLSGGAIAGIVIGSVVGLIILCLICFFIVVGGSRGKSGKSVETSMPSKGHSTLEESRVENSQVELGGATTTSEEVH